MKDDKKKLRFISEGERLRQDIYRPDMEKFHLFTQMLRRNALFKKAKVTHKTTGELSQSS